MLEIIALLLFILILIPICIGVLVMIGVLNVSYQAIRDEFKKVKKESEDSTNVIEPEEIDKEQSSLK